MAGEQNWDYIIVGGGIIGTAVTRALAAKKREARILLLEKEPDLALHTSGRNSGVVHSGYNQKPGTLKAKFCVEGNSRIREYCKSRKLPLLEGGILIVAQKESDIPALEVLKDRGRRNGVRGMKMVNPKDIRRIEPCARGIAGLHVPSGATVDNRRLVLSLAEDAAQSGATIRAGCPALEVAEEGTGYRIRTPSGTVHANYLINCAGLHADKVAHSLGAGLEYTIAPFRGEYYILRPEKAWVLKSMVYEAPDLEHPYLRIHWTKWPDGRVLVGPNAILAFGRESYRFWDIHWRDLAGMALDSRFWKLLRNKEFLGLLKAQFKTSLSRKVFLGHALRLVTGPGLSDFESGESHAGIRAQLIDRQGNLVDDLVVEQKGNSLHVLNAVSPGFTCSLPFADYLVDRLC